MDHREHSIWFDEYNTWDTWRIVPSSRPTPSIPEIQTNVVEIPGRSGSLDLSEALTGYPLYNNRTLEVQFIVLDQKAYWMDIYTSVAEKLHGKRMKIRLIDDPDWYYVGRVTVGFTSNSDYSSIDVSCDLEPFRYSVDEIELTTELGYNDFDRESEGIYNYHNFYLATADTSRYGDEFDGLPTNSKTRMVYEPEITITTTKSAAPVYAFSNIELGISISKSAGNTLNYNSNNKSKNIIISNQSGENFCTLDIVRPSDFVSGDTLSVTVKLREKRI